MTKTGYERNSVNGRFSSSKVCTFLDDILNMDFPIQIRKRDTKPPKIDLCLKGSIYILLI